MPLNPSNSGTPNTLRLRKSSQFSSGGRVPSMHWLFRSNIPRHRNSYLSPDIHKRNFFGMGEIVGVLSNVCCFFLFHLRPLRISMSQRINRMFYSHSLRRQFALSRNPNAFWTKLVVKSLRTKNGRNFARNTPSLDFLAFSLAKQKFKGSRRPSKANHPSPFYSGQVPRERWLTLLLVSLPAVAEKKEQHQTALLREVLSQEKYHVLHFDLRIAGFADLASLYLRLSQQMELYFEEISNKMPGYEDFRKEAWSFKVPII